MLNRLKQRKFDDLQAQDYEGSSRPKFNKSVKEIMSSGEAIDLLKIKANS